MAGSDEWRCATDRVGDRLSGLALALDGDTIVVRMPRAR